ncbi:MAG: sigma-70 family RNA polymerase sigma factor [Planctomycetota bacterium]
MDPPERTRDAADSYIAGLFIDEDPDGPRVLLEVHGDALNSYLEWKLGRGGSRSLSADQIEDVLMVSVQKYWKDPLLYDESKGTLRGWLRKVVHNAAIDYLRKEPDWDTVPEDYDPAAVPETVCEPQSGKAKAKEKKLVAAIQAIVDTKLSPLQQKIITADIAAGGSVAADLLSAELGISMNSVFVHRSKAKKRIMQALEEQGLSLGGKEDKS